MSKTILFQTIQLEIELLALVRSLHVKRVLFQAIQLTHRYDPIRSYHNGNEGVLKAPALLEPRHQIVLCHIRTLVEGGAYTSAEVQPVYSTVPADRATVAVIEYAEGISAQR